jgi:hypothetical protein
MHVLRQYFHLRGMLVKTLAISQCNYTTLTDFGQPGQGDTNRNNPIWVTSTKVAKESMGGIIDKTCYNKVFWH